MADDILPFIIENKQESFDIKMINNKQKILIETFNKFCGGSVEPKEADFQRVFKYANEYIVYKINLKMKEFKTVDEMSTKLGVTQKKSFNLLKNYYNSFVKNSRLEQEFFIPNEKNELVSSNELEYCVKIEEKLHKKTRCEIEPDFLKLSNIVYNRILQEENQKLREELERYRSPAQFSFFDRSPNPSHAPQQLRSAHQNPRPIHQSPRPVPQYTLHPQIAAARRDYHDTSSDIFYNRVMYLYNFLIKSGKFSHVEQFRLTEEPNSRKSIIFNGEKYYIRDSEDVKYDILAETDDGYKFYITVRATNISISENNDLPLDIKILNEISRECGFNDEDDGEIVLAVFWGSAADINSSFFFTPSRIYDFIQ